MTRTDVIWRESPKVRYYLDSLRGALLFAAEQFAVMLRFIAAGGRPVERVLDLGSGDGILSAVLLERYPDATAVLVDFSEPMLAAARARLPVASAQLVPADLAAPGWHDGVTPWAPYDAAVSGFAIHHLPDDRKRALYGEIFSLLAPGGAFVHLEHIAPEQAWMSAAFHDAMIDAVHYRARRDDPEVSRAESAAVYWTWEDRNANILAPLEAQCAWLREAGFVEVAAPFRWYEIAVFGGRRPA
jgi:trans-aconitate methyltransferase